MTTTELPAQARYSWGADEHLVVQIAEDMSLSAFFRAGAISSRLAERAIDGVLDICPANASLLIRFDPEVLAPADLEAAVREIEADVARQERPSISTRIVEIPVWYDDPYTREVGAKFRDRHQRPEGTDLEYGMVELGLSSVDEFIEKHSSTPWMVSMVGFVAGLPFMFQMVDQADYAFELPKYLRPRTETPKLTVGHGGCFACIYSVKGAGGYQMFGVTPLPIFDPSQGHEVFADSMVLFRPGDIVKFRPVDEAEYRELEAAAERGEDVYRIVPVDFELDEFLADPVAYNTNLLGALHD
ncbi:MULTISPECIES: carboxyltransferase domain-containing protein [unclassified Gordonia (in: high G+C Gram-positive bacteria)]|uniref:5-oxoprolinase subunit B family protein n=1 Tax=unclassified Gordonia (in: high G+C Gram-positive bacteria) TaxID=2657482 RepID=UPI001F071184|nr:carboxyltransferase domain-containing protein [Gordonia sp. PDNC005]